MDEFVIVEISHERRTYLKGRFKGKYCALIDEEWSDEKRENYYNIEIYEGEITTKNDSDHFIKWQDARTFEEFDSIENFTTPIPSPIVCNVKQPDDTFKCFNVELNDVKLKDIHLYNQLHEGDKLFGTIEGDICGYFIHYDIEKVKVPVAETEQHKGGGPVNGMPEPGAAEIKDDYIRRVIKDTSTGETVWSKWEPIPKVKKTGSASGISDFFGFIFGVLGLLYWLFIAFVIISMAWKILLPIAGIWLFFFLLSSLPSVFSNLSRWLLQLLSFGFFIYLAIGLFSLFRNPFPVIKRTIAQDDTQERPRQRNDNSYSDTVIAHYRIWKDYRDTTYKAWIEVLKSDFVSSSNYRLNLPNNLTSTSDYNSVVYSLSTFDKSRLNRIYTMFDSLRKSNTLSEKQFAEAIVSCVQDIPYVLVLDKACSSSLYDDAFISNYIRQGGNCEGYVKYGLYSPVEFSGNLKGDCDTRTLLLYTILTHYDYDVAMLGSDAYRHSIIAINLPYRGVSKIIQGKKYVLWETTAPQMKPGDIPNDISNPDFWQVNLLSKPITS
jgi:desulfoferrodoxin (superoxide reductase-like protein)